MLNEECCKSLKIPRSLCPFVLYSCKKHTSVIGNYRYDFGPKLLEFLGVKRAYKEDLYLRKRILGQLSYQINYKINMYGHEPSKKKKEILKKYSDLEIDQDEWDINCLCEEGREQYLKECAAMDI